VPCGCSGTMGLYIGGEERRASMEEAIVPTVGLPISLNAIEGKEEEDLLG
jgi:hypothetical protein